MHEEYAAVKAYGFQKEKGERKMTPIYYEVVLIDGDYARLNMRCSSTNWQRNKDAA